MTRQVIDAGEIYIIGVIALAYVRMVKCGIFNRLSFFTGQGGGMAFLYVHFAFFKLFYLKIYNFIF